ncbi:MAG: DNA cytosine methyltransferase [Desertifilum sp.]|nr:DNA cytosine methyltransferase [Desertifilum sp.]
MNQPVISLFAGCGGLDLGFSQAGFDLIWANEFDREIWQTYRTNHPQTFLDKRSIRDIPSEEIPDCIGIIGGPPCQSWSEAGSQRGIEDERGQLFLEYVRVLRDKQPLFFLAENVSGLLHQKHRKALNNIIAAFEEAGYWLTYKLLNAVDYQVPQDRKRVILVGYHMQLNQRFDFAHLIPHTQPLTLKDAIWDLRKTAIPAIDKCKTNGNTCQIPNHEYMTGGFSSIYMSRNRVRRWDEPSFTIQAGGRHAPIHPQANKMIHVGKDKFIFDPNSPLPYRRLSVRECARIQTFPDNFIFDYKNLNAGYKMIGNAVPVRLGYELATTILRNLLNASEKTVLQTEIMGLPLSLR